MLTAAYGDKRFFTAEGNHFPQGTPFYSTAGTDQYNKQDAKRAKDMAEKAGYKGETIRLLTSRNFEFHHTMMQEKPNDSEGRSLKARQEWNVVDFSMLKRQWEEYMKWGKVLPRYEKSIEHIEKIFTENILKVTLNTELAGHTQSSSKEEWREFFDGMEESEKEKMVEYMDEYFGDWIHDGRQWRISDYGLKPLHKLLVQLRKEFDPSKKLPILDKMLNVVHARSDIASWFVEGGSTALSQLSGMED
jgi:hypothetical protein